MYIHKYDKRNAAEIGHKAERLFASAAGKRGYLVRGSTIDENKIKRVDIYLKKGEEIKGVDVKARKKINSSDKKYNDYWTWVEFKTADGFDGWMYGDADYIAFEKEDYFLVVNCESLRNLAESLVDRNKEFVKTPEEAKYRVYQRRGEEQLSLIKTSDIKKLKRIAIWKK